MAKYTQIQVARLQGLMDAENANKLEQKQITAPIFDTIVGETLAYQLANPYGTQDVNTGSVKFPMVKLGEVAESADPNGNVDFSAWASAGLDSVQLFKDERFEGKFKFNILDVAKSDLGALPAMFESNIQKAATVKIEKEFITLLETGAEVGNKVNVDISAAADTKAEDAIIITALDTAIDKFRRLSTDYAIKPAKSEFMFMVNTRVMNSIRRTLAYEVTGGEISAKTFMDSFAQVNYNGVRMIENPWLDDYSVVVGSEDLAFIALTPNRASALAVDKTVTGTGEIPGNPEVHYFITKWIKGQMLIYPSEVLVGTLVTSTTPYVDKSKTNKPKNK